MKAQIEKKYLGTTLKVEVEGADLKKTLLQAAIFTENDECFLCKNKDIGLSGNQTEEGHVYIKRVCTNPSCRATSTMGTYKNGAGHFWHKWEIYKPMGEQTGEKNANGTMKNSLPNFD